MAQAGDTITYTFAGAFGGSVNKSLRYSEDVSNIDKIVIDYVDGGGGASADSQGGHGGRVENVKADVSSVSTIYIWVSGSENGRPIYGRYPGSANDNGTQAEGAGSTEVSLLPTDVEDSDTEPFIAAAGGGGGGYKGASMGRWGARSSQASSTSNTGEEPPQGGSDGNSILETDGGDGEGAVAGHGSTATIIDSGTTITGGGSPPDADGEVRISYKVDLGPPSNLTVTDNSVEGEISLSWDEGSGAAGYFVYRAESSGSTTADYTKVADVTSTSYTDTGLEDGEQYFYRVSSHD